MNSSRTDDKSKESEFDYYLKSGMSPNHVISALKAIGKDQKEIDSFIEKYDVSRKRIAKVIKKFVGKLEAKYDHIDEQRMIHYGMKFAEKYKFTQAEKDAFMNFIKNGDVNKPYVPYDEMQYTEMTKFLGMTQNSVHSFTVKATDQAPLNEIAKLYELTKPLHNAVRQNYIAYKSSAIQVMNARFSSEKYNPAIHIHPLIVALFLNKIPCLENRCLLTNIGRFTVHRTQQYFQSQGDRRYKYMNLSLNDILKNELQYDAAFIFEIAKDPNSLNYISDETPMKNLLNRFMVQIELWKNVLLMRRGQFFSKSMSFSQSKPDEISGLETVLSSYEWTYYDSPDMSLVNDEGTMLRKLLAVFSFRPTLTRISSLARSNDNVYSNISSLSRSTYIFTPIVNIKLPQNDGTVSSVSVDIEKSLSHSDWMIENKMLIPKNKQIIKSTDIIFFYVNRRYQSPFETEGNKFNYLVIPTPLTMTTLINNTIVNFPSSLSISSTTFDISSVIIANPPLTSNENLSSGCTAFIWKTPDVIPTVDNYVSNITAYSPILFNDEITSGDGTGSNKGPNYLQNVTNESETRNLMRKNGTIYVYVAKQ
jgi:hypothetical protein